jgi:hypothetical protein
MIFLSWTWHDSEHYRNYISYGTATYFIGAESRDGGFSFYADYKNPSTPSGLNFSREEKYLRFLSTRRRAIICYGPTDFHYSSPMIVVFLTTTAWLTWRWRKTVAALPQCHANP